MSENKLKYSKSPYLLQHANNPVNWFEWGDEAFNKAKEENKPIFLSIGYSTCHWCHVMEHESFENQEVARLLNDDFICIKVDREERPDIDNFYMTVCQMMNSNCGWPLSSFMTPDKKPFFVSTYIPREGMYGRPGMMELLPELTNYWRTRREDILSSSDKILDKVAFATNPNPGEIKEEELLDIAYNELRNSFDSIHGGFGNRPKFPIPHNLMFLMKNYTRTSRAEALTMVTLSLEKMRKGGMYDHLGYGFHRYSTDSRWFLPHFEKMLYDQAGLMRAYAEACLLTGNEEFARTSREIFAYVKRNLGHPEGGFFSAEDADSEGVEGKFYVWSFQELKQLLSGTQLDLFTEVFNIKKDGNFKEEATGEETGLNVPFLIKSLKEYSAAHNIPLEALENEIEEIRSLLFAEREKRIKPGLDDKILTDWNGLFISALARTAHILNDSEMLLSAQNGMSFILNKLRKRDGTLLHRFRNSEAGIDAFLDDYAFVIQALIQLYRTDFDISYLSSALALTQITIDNFWDEHGGFYFTSANSNDLLIRKKEFYDGAVPSGNSVMTANLITLARYSGKIKWEEMARKLLSQNVGTYERAPSAYTQMMNSLEILISQKHQLVITCSDEKELGNTLNKIGSHSPDVIILLKNKDNSEILDSIAPFTKEMPIKEDKMEFYLCQDNACQQPTDSLESLLETLST